MDGGAGIHDEELLKEIYLLNSRYMGMGMSNLLMASGVGYVSQTTIINSPDLHYSLLAQNGTADFFQGLKDAAPKYDLLQTQSLMWETKRYMEQRKYFDEKKSGKWASIIASFEKLMIFTLSYEEMGKEMEILNSDSDPENENHISKTVLSFYLIHPKIAKFFSKTSRPLHIKIVKGYSTQEKGWLKINTWNQQTNPEGLKNMNFYLTKNQALFIEGTGSRTIDPTIRIYRGMFRGPGNVTVNFTPSIIPFLVTKYQLMEYNKWHKGYNIQFYKGTW